MRVIDQQLDFERIAWKREVVVRRVSQVQKLRKSDFGVGDWGLGIGDWGLGIRDLALAHPRPQHPTPNPQSPIPKNPYPFTAPANMPRRK